MHYSQKKRYYFFIAIVKFKTILSYYPRWRKLPPHTLANFQSLPKLIAPPLAQVSSPMLILRLSFPPLAQACSLCQFKIFSPLILRHILSCASSLTFLRHILGCASSPTFLRLSFAYPSLILRLSFAQPSPNSKFIIQNS